jgi:hypothetical protein
MVIASRKLGGSVAIGIPAFSWASLLQRSFGGGGEPHLWLMVAYGGTLGTTSTLVSSLFGPRKLIRREGPLHFIFLYRSQIPWVLRQVFVHVSASRVDCVVGKLRKSFHPSTKTTKFKKCVSRTNEVQVLSSPRIIANS